jgi:putative endopeptidase
MKTVNAITFAASLLVFGASVGSATGAPAAGLDLQDFDASVSPQADFYRYVNGGWLARTEIPADRASWGNFDVLDEAARHVVRAILEEPSEPGARPDSEQKKLKTFYDSFMDQATVERRGLAPLRPEFARIRAIRDKSDLVVEIAHLNRIGVRAPLDFGVHQDNRDSTRYIVDLVQSGLGMPDRDYYLKDDAKLKDTRAKYRDYVSAMLALTGDRNADADAGAILALETRLAEAQWTKVENRDPVRTYNRLDTAKLSELTTEIDWQRYLATAGVAAKIRDLTVKQPSYVTKLGRIIDGTPIEQWRTYFKWHVLNDAAPYLSKVYVDTRFAFYGTTLRDVPTLEERWKRGVGATEAAMGEALGRQYVQRTFSAESKARAEALIGNLLTAFRTSIETLDWMGPETKREAQAKLAAFTAKIGYPKRWRDYSKLVVKPGDLYGNVTRAILFETERDIAKLGQPIDRDEWHLTPQTVNAYYNPELNEIVFPAAILQPPFFHAEADDAVNYGAIGAVIGHEISHGFDDRGSQFDGQGNLRDWWTKEDHERFAAKTAALITQYARYEPVQGYSVNGQLTLGENIADNSGLAVAYKAYQISLHGTPAAVLDGLTGDQRFYAGFATVWRAKVRESESIRRVKIDPHSPPQFRVRGALANQDPFFAALGIKDGDDMYTAPASRVRIW